MSNIMEKALAQKDYMTVVRRHFHENPELSFKEYKTTEFIKKELNEMGIELQPLDTETGVVALIRGEKPGPDIVTAVRADIDALPVDEKSGVPYSSKNQGVMHACGHDGHAAVLLGVAKILNEMKDSFSGMAKLIFQPAEEGLGGAKLMVNAGCLENPKVENIVALHAWPDLKVGEVGAWAGKYMASADMFKVRIIGRGGHGARPVEAINPINAAAQAVTAIQGIVSNEVATTDAAVVTVCMINAGKAFNVIPDDISFGGTVRCLDETTRQGIKDKIERIVKGICETFGCQYEYDYTFGVSAVVNHPEITERLLTGADKVLGEGHVKALPGPTMGSEDFSEFIAAVGKGAFMRLGIGAEDREKISLHNDRFDFNDEALVYGASVMAQYVLDSNS